MRGERRGRRGAPRGRWTERAGEGGGRGGGALAGLGPDADAAAHMAVVEDDAERERRRAGGLDLGERGMIRHTIFEPMGELHFDA